MNKALALLIMLLGPTGILATCPATVPSGVTICYYAAANGSDSNDGLSEASGHPWLHAPGMINCASACATEWNALSAGATGVGIILRGGDTWHFGNSGLSPYTGNAPSGNGSNCDAGNSCGWVIGANSSLAGNPWIGTVAHPNYIGIDQTWFTGGSWTRPVLTGDNPLSSVGVSSCTFNSNNLSLIQIWTGSTNLIIDNFEFTGLCWSGNNTVSNATYIWNKNHFSPDVSNRKISNNYFHGWSHVTFSCSGGGSTGNCEAAWAAISGPSDRTEGVGDDITHNVFDGTDTDQQSYSAVLFGAYIFEYNVCTHMAQCIITNNSHSDHDNLLDTIYGLSDGQAHGNGIEHNSEYNATNVFYNNVIKNFAPGGAGCGNVQVWRAPSTLDYAFNNIIFNDNCGITNYWDLITSNQCCGSDGWTSNEFNNTFIIAANGPFNNSTMNGTSTINMSNTHCVTTNGGSGGAACHIGNATYNYLTNTTQTTTTATSQGYTAAQTFAYSPTSAGNATVGTGTNKQAFCTTLLGSSDATLQAAGTACQSDTTYAVSYNATNHTVISPARTPVLRPISAAWDTGAYQFGILPPAPAGTMFAGIEIQNGVTKR